MATALEIGNSASNGAMQDGFLNVDKPAGWTSRDVVNVVQRLVRPAKVGHAGTLDPLATGVLAIAVGPATRLVPYLQQQPKAYVARFELGQFSETDDVDGAVQRLCGAPVPSRNELEAALPRFVGEIAQRPPNYSAVQVAGQRAYHRARSGEQFELPSRTVVVHDLVIDDYDYPSLTLRVHCGSGTFVRALGRDLAHALGTAAVMSALRRTAVGPLRVELAAPLAELTAATIDARMLPRSVAVEHLPRVVISRALQRRIAYGQRVRTADLADVACDEAAALDDAGQVVAVLHRAGSDWRVPVHFCSADRAGKSTRDI